VAKTEPGDENNQDISSLVGKVDIRKLEMLGRTTRTPTASPAGLNRANQGILEFVEMFKAPIKMLHPLLTATQEGKLHRHREHRRHPLPGIIMATPTRRSGRASEQQNNEPSSTASTSSRCPTACG
jgi:serine protein kinase